MTLAEDAFVTVIKLLANNPSSPPTQAAYITKCINLSEVLEYFTPLQKHTRSK